jgi:hypothetical protein
VLKVSTGGLSSHMLLNGQVNIAVFANRRIVQGRKGKATRVLGLDSRSRLEVSFTFRLILLPGKNPQEPAGRKLCGLRSESGCQVAAGGPCFKYRPGVWLFSHVFCDFRQSLQANAEITSLLIIRPRGLPSVSFTFHSLIALSFSVT